MTMTGVGKIPQGLVKCPVCGEYNGSVLQRDLNQLRHASNDDTKILTVRCLCSGIICPKCKKNRIHRPTSNSYDPETNEVWHNPWFMGMVGCRQCRRKIEAESNHTMDGEQNDS